MKIYLASPFFNEQERQTVKDIALIMRRKGLEVIVPMECEVKDAWALDNAEWGRNVFKMDKQHIHSCDAMLMVNYGLYSDSGTAWECGFAYALNIPVIVLNLSFLSSLMVNNGSHSNLNSIEELEEYDFKSLLVNYFTGEQK